MRLPKQGKVCIQLEDIDLWFGCWCVGLQLGKGSVKYLFLPGVRVVDAYGR